MKPGGDETGTQLRPGFCRVYELLDRIREHARAE